MNANRVRLLLAGAFLAIFYFASCLPGCSSSYNSLSDPNGQAAIIQQAGDDIDAGDCQQALSVLQPLIQSQYADYDSYIAYSSAYACEGGLFFPAFIGNLRNLNGDIWSALVASDPSDSLSDGRRAAIDEAELYLLYTATPQLSYSAAARTSDANMYMVFQQLTTIALTLGPLGQANTSTGQKTQSIAEPTGVYAMTDECHIEVAFATINDSLNALPSGSVTGSVSSAMSTACSALGGSCPTETNITNCMNGSNDTVAGSDAYQGWALLNAIDAQWQ